MACSRDYTVAYVFSTSASNGTVSAYAVDYQSGELTQITGSPFAGQVGNNPVTLVAAPNQKSVSLLDRGDPRVSIHAGQRGEFKQPLRLTSQTA